MNSMFLMVSDYTKPVEGFGDKLSFGGTMVLIGMLAVFAVLFIIYLSLVIFKFAFQGTSDKKKKKENDTLPPSPDVQDIPVAATDDEEIVAVVAAAIAMAESESDGMKFRVVSFKRV